MDGGSKHRATQRNKASQPAKIESSARMGVVVDALAHASGEAGRGRPQHTWDEANRDAARSRSRFRSGLVTAVRRVTPAVGPRPPAKQRVVSTKEQVLRSKSPGVSREE